MKGEQPLTMSEAEAMVASAWDTMERTAAENAAHTKELLGRIAALDKALREYGQHRLFCPAEGYSATNVICECGLRAVLTAMGYEPNTPPVEVPGEDPDEDDEE